MEKPLFANARSIRNDLDRARMRQANRVFEGLGRVLTKADLVTITPEDILKSSLFESGESQNTLFEVGQSLW